MELSKSKKKIHDRRSFVYKEYCVNVAPMDKFVGKMAMKFGVTTITIYNDIKFKKREDFQAREAIL